MSRYLLILWISYAALMGVLVGASFDSAFFSPQKYSSGEQKNSAADQKSLEGRQEATNEALADAVFVPVAVIESYVLQHTGGTFMYPLDDTFIHMALARNLSYHGNWGMNPYEFASASSSVLYTLLLAGLFKLFSVQVLSLFWSIVS